MKNSVDPDQTAPTLFASLLKCVSNVRQCFAAETSADIIFQMRFFLALFVM